MSGDRVAVHMPHTLFLLRHGETEWNREGKIQGSLDSPLTGLGRLQATRQAGILARDLPRPDALGYYCSPLPRARETARIALGGVAPVVDPRLRELDCGAWEGLTPAERAGRDPDLVATCATDWDLYMNAPGGEGLTRLESRLRDFLSDIPGPAIIVAHKVVLTVIRGLLTNLPRTDWHRISAPQGAVIRVADGREETLS